MNLNFLALFILMLYLKSEDIKKDTKKIIIKSNIGAIYFLGTKPKFKCKLDENYSARFKKCRKIIKKNVKIMIKEKYRNYSRNIKRTNIDIFLEIISNEFVKTALKVCNEIMSDIIPEDLYFSVYDNGIYKNTFFKEMTINLLIFIHCEKLRGYFKLKETKYMYNKKNSFLWPISNRIYKNIILNYRKKLIHVCTEVLLDYIYIESFGDANQVLKLCNLNVKKSSRCKCKNYENIVTGEFQKSLISIVGKNSKDPVKGKSLNCKGFESFQKLRSEYYEYNFEGDKTERYIEFLICLNIERNIRFKYKNEKRIRIASEDSINKIESQFENSLLNYYIDIEKICNNNIYVSKAKQKNSDIGNCILSFNESETQDNFIKKDKINNLIYSESIQKNIKIAVPILMDINTQSELFIDDFNNILKDYSKKKHYCNENEKNDIKIQNIHSFKNNIKVHKPKIFEKDIFSTDKYDIYKNFFDLNISRSSHLVFNNLFYEDRPKISFDVNLSDGNDYRSFQITDEKLTLQFKIFKEMISNSTNKKAGNLVFLDFFIENIVILQLYGKNPNNFSQKMNKNIKNKTFFNKNIISSLIIAFPSTELFMMSKDCINIPYNKEFNVFTNSQNQSCDKKFVEKTHNILVRAMLSLIVNIHELDKALPLKDCIICIPKRIGYKIDEKISNFISNYANSKELETTNTYRSDYYYNFLNNSVGKFYKILNDWITDEVVNIKCVIFDMFVSKYNEIDIYNLIRKYMK